MANSYRHSEFFLQVFLADGSGLFGRAGLVRYNIEFDDGPPAEIHFVQCSKDRGKVHASPAQLHEAKGALASFAVRYGFYILDVQEKQAVLIFLDSLGGIATTLEVMRSEEHTSELQSLRHLVCR